MSIQVEDFINGIRTGNYVPKVGCQFGSMWRSDGLLVTEATPQEYAAFGASSHIKLCHGPSVTWLEEEWQSILAYDGQQLSQVNLHTALDANKLADCCGWLESVLGKGRELGDGRTIWSGRDGTALLVRTPSYVQISLRRYSWIRRLLKWFGI